MTSRIPLALIVMASLAGPALADSADDAASAFVNGDGFEMFSDPAVLADLLDMTLLDTGRARKDADITALEKAILLLEANETFVPRARYAARIGIEFHGEIPVSFVEVERYNFGPLIWRDAVDAYGEDNTAPIETFGVGPHVAWRIASQPNTTASAMLLAASRREISDEEAAQRECVVQNCLGGEPLEFLAEWPNPIAFDIAMPDLAYGVQVAAGEGAEDEAFEEQLSTARIALQLAAAAGLASVDENGVLWSAEPSEGFGPNHPFAQLTIDRNLGQDVMSDGILAIEPMDGDLGQRWIRLTTSGVDDDDLPLVWIVEGELKPAVPQEW